MARLIENLIPESDRGFYKILEFFKDTLVDNDFSSFPCIIVNKNYIYYPGQGNIILEKMDHIYLFEWKYDCFFLKMDYNKRYSGSYVFYSFSSLADYNRYCDWLSKSKAVNCFPLPFFS